METKMTHYEIQCRAKGGWKCWIGSTNRAQLEEIMARQEGRAYRLISIEGARLKILATKRAS